MIASTALAIAIGTNLGTWHKNADNVESVPNAYAVVTIMNQSIAVGTMRRNNAWLGWRGETSPVAVFGVPVRAAVTVGATADRKATYAVLERDWRLYMLSADRRTNRPQGGGKPLATVVGRKTVVEPLMLLSVGAEVAPGWTVWLSKSDSIQLSLEKAFK